MTRGVVTHDEGYILHSAEKIFDGQIPYRDFHFVYTPLSIFLTWISFVIFQPSILSSRILMILIALLSSGLIFKTIMYATKNKLYATIAVLTFVSWGPTHINFAWPVMFAIFTAFLFSFLLLKFTDSRKSRYLFLAGIAAFFVFLAKQNFGIAILIPSAIFFSIKHARSLKYTLPFIYGYLWGIIFFAVYLLATGSFAPFLYDLYDFTIKRIFINESLTTNFIYKDTLIVMLSRTAFYLLPLALSLAAFILLFLRRRFHLLFLPATVAVFYIVGIRPTTDYTHLVPLLSLCGIPLALYLRFNIQSTIRMLILIFTFTFIFLGFNTALFKGYYRWDTPLTKHNNFSSNPKINIFLNDKFYNEFKELQNIADTYTATDDYIFVNSYNPLLYFVMNRKEPTKNNVLATEIDPQQYYDEALGNLVAKQIKIVILDHKSLNNLPIKKYIENNYRFDKTIQDFDIYLRNP
ncbi:MAG: glycosyltransferase family 39 protein [Candidatus Levybacteria bacterium]|nr:glycosyltransferase family 39 protein [Candidatus Levybacteria bacterium]